MMVLQLFCVSKRNVADFSLDIRVEKWHVMVKLFH